jgi:hypothetical protein
MNAVAAAPTIDRSAKNDRVSLIRLVWVAPLTVAVALGVNLLIRFAVQSLSPATGRMPQLSDPMVTLTVEGVLAAIIVFVLVALFVPRPIFVYRIIGVVALLISVIPDIALVMGGAPMFAAMRLVGPLTSIGSPSPPPGPGGPGGPPAGGPPPGFSQGMPLEQALVLMGLHAATAIVCIVLLTTLTRRRIAAQAQA